MSPAKTPTRKRKIRLNKQKSVSFDGKKKQYEKQLEKLQQKMLRIQQAYHRQQRRAVLAFEGWDAAGKGGCIRRLTTMLDPRGFHVYPIGAPDPVEQGKHYLFRFWRLLPEKGQLAIFDRTWYGRVLVERVEGFAETSAWKRAYREINEFERALVDDGARVIKVFLQVSAKEQKRRFYDRLHNPYKRWKLTPDDLRNLDKREQYTEAIEDMFDHTDTKYAPWNVIVSNHKWHARLAVLRLAIKQLGKDVDLSAPIADPEFLAEAEEILG